MRVRWQQAVALRGATARGVHWPPLLAACAAAAGLTAWQDAALGRPGRAELVLRAAAVVLAAGVVVVTDDAAAVSVASSPTPLSWRRLLRYVVATGFVLPTWVAVVVRGVGHRPDLPWPRLSLELATLVALGLAAAAAAARWSDTADPSAAGVLCVLGFVALVASLPPGLAFWSVPGSTGWHPSTLRWTATLLVASALLVAASRDPAVRLGPARRPLRYHRQ